MKRDEYLIGIHDLPAILEAATKLSTKHGFQSRDWQILTSPPLLFAPNLAAFLCWRGKKGKLFGEG